MNKIILLFTISILTTACKYKKTPHIVSLDVNFILEQIKSPEILSDTFNIKQYGALGDSVTPCHNAIEKAINAIKKQNGGILYFPAGQYFMNGPIHMVSNMEIHLAKDAHIFFSSNPDDFLPVVKTSWEGTFLYNYSPFIYAYNCKNIKITGKGIIDGDAANTWTKWREIQKKDQLASREMNHKEIPVDKRIFGKGHYLRPQLIQLFSCQNILIEGIKLEDSPFWCVHLLKCENATVKNIKYDAQNKNNDGIDPEYSKNILIENITFNNSDDNIAIKSGRDNEGRTSEDRSENIIIRNCHFKGLHAIVIGSEMSAGVQNVFVKDCDFAGKLKRGIYIKSNPDRGGFIKNIFFNNLNFGEVEDCIYITSFYHNEGKGFFTNIDNIHFDNINCDNATGSGIVLQGFPEKKLSGIYFKNINIKEANNPISMENTENINFSDVIIGKLATSPSFKK